MKRINHSITYERTGFFHVNGLEENYYYDWYNNGEMQWRKVVHFSSYQIYKIYTNKGTALNAYSKLNGDTATKQIVFNTDNTRCDFEQEQLVISQILYNDSFNCHGYTFLDGMFWFELNSETVKIILTEDGYTPCEREDLKPNGILLFYNERDELIHSAKMFKDNGKEPILDKGLSGRVVSKFGINQILTQSEEEIYEKYKTVIRSKTRYYNPTADEEDAENSNIEKN